MKKQILGVAISMLVISSLSANNDLQNNLDFAFGGEVQANNVLVLNDEQMSEIQGKGLRKAFKSVVKAVIQTPVKQVVAETKRVGSDINWHDNKFLYASLATGGIWSINMYAVGFSAANGVYSSNGHQSMNLNSSSIARGAISGVATTIVPTIVGRIPVGS